MLFPVDNEARQMKELNGIWKFKRDCMSGSFGRRQREDTICFKS